MRLSSFHKQKQDKVVLLNENCKVNGEYDIIYCVRDNFNSKLPNLDIMDNDKTIVMGDAMKFFPNYKAEPSLIAAIRPDYLLFNSDILNLSPLEKSQYVEITHGFGLLETRQDFTNNFRGKKNTIVTDKNLWDLNDDVVLQALEILRKIPNIAFREPIKIKRILDNKKIEQSFLSLNFSKIIKSRFVNNFGNTTEDIKQIINFLSSFIAYKNFKPLRIQSLVAPNLDQNLSRECLFRDLEIMDCAKQKQIRINITCPAAAQSDYIDYFKAIKRWSNNDPKKSFIEFMCSYSLDYTPNLEEIFLDRKNWLSYNTRELLYLLKNYYEIIEPWIFRKWGNQFLDLKINIDYIRKEM